MAAEHLKQYQFKKGGGKGGADEAESVDNPAEERSEMKKAYPKASPFTKRKKRPMMAEDAASALMSKGGR